MKTNQQLIQEFKNFKLSKYEFFWNHNYRHIMRGLKYNKRKSIYNDFLKFGLTLDSSSDIHEQIIKENIGDYNIKGENKKERVKILKESYKIGFC